MEEKYCISTKRPVTNDPEAVSFPCPSCSREIVRSGYARKNAIRYTCPSCEFTGPN